MTKRSVGQKQEEALRLLFSRVLALPLMYQVYMQCSPSLNFMSKAVLRSLTALAMKLKLTNYGKH